MATGPQLTTAPGTRHTDPLSGIYSPIAHLTAFLPSPEAGGWEQIERLKRIAIASTTLKA